MAVDLERFRTECAHTRYRPGQTAGHYESFFARANHPSRPLAFWIRYTIFNPHARPEAALGELWAVYFDGDRNQHVAVKREVPLTHCTFSNDELRIRVDHAHLQPGALSGTASAGPHTLEWELSFAGDAAPLAFLPLPLYERRLPKAKSLVILPMAVFRGTLVVDDQPVNVADWVGSLNHNWGSQHTDQYAWGQVAGFDTHPTSFLEVATARLKFGPFWTPFMTLLVLRHGGEEITLNGLGQAFRARGSFEYFTWHFTSATSTHRIAGRLTAPRSAFVGLRYGNPPGGIKHCLNTKLASCEVRVATLHNGQVTREETLSTSHRAAFEILTSDRTHGVEIRV